MYNCDICGREIFKKIKCNKRILCSKHYHQFLKYGYFLDNNPRSAKDYNNYVIIDDIAIFDVYNQKQVKIGEFIVDAEDVEKIKYHKWRFSYGRVVTGNSSKTKPLIYLTHMLLDVPETDYYNKIDHIDGNASNNRKSNLRICTQGQNTLNKVSVSNNTSGVIGVHPDKRKNRGTNWCAEIRINNKRWHIGAYKTIEEAAYSRYIAECELFGEFRNTSSDESKFKLFSSIENSRKKDIENYVLNKIKTP